MLHGKYEVQRALAVGGTAVVYQVVHVTTRRPAALEVMASHMLSESGMRARFALEARAPAGIESQAIVEVLDAAVDDVTGSPFIVMELLRGNDLENTLRLRGRLAREQVVDLLSQVAPAIDAVHAARIVHRDLKPGNLFLADAAPSIHHAQRTLTPRCPAPAGGAGLLPGSAGVPCAHRSPRRGTTLALHDDPGPSTPDSRSSGRFGGGTTAAIFAIRVAGVMTKCVAPFFLGLRRRYPTRPSASRDSRDSATGPRAA
jgi:hypothetical protein